MYSSIPWLPSLLLCAAAAAQSPLLTVHSAPGLNSYATGAFPAGDLDGDGFTDFAQTLPAANDFDGELTVHSGRDGRRILALAGNPGGRSVLGWSAVGAGDLDGDGHGELVVGMPRAKLNGIGVGAIRVYSGRTGQLLRTHYGDGSGDLFGNSTAGDPAMTAAEGGAYAAGTVGGSPADRGMVPAGIVGGAPADRGLVAVGTVKRAPADGGAVAAGRIFRAPADGGPGTAGPVPDTPSYRGVRGGNGVMRPGD